LMLNVDSPERRLKIQNHLHFTTDSGQ